MKKGQITVFIIIGLFAVFAVGLLIYFSLGGKIESKQFPQEIRQKLQLSIQSCMKASLDESIKQTARTINNNFIDYKNDKYSLLISLSPEFSKTEKSTTISNKPPSYPWSTFPFFEGNKVFQAQSLFGWNILPSYDELKKILETKTKENFKECIKNIDNNDLIKDISEIKLIFEDNSMAAQINKVSLKFENIETTLQNLLIQSRTEIKNAHAFVNDLLNQEISDVKSTTQNSLNFIVNKEKDNLKNTLLKISSRTEDLTFLIAIPNRYPALEYINTSFFNNTNLLCPNSKVEFITPDKIKISGGTPPTEACDPNQETICTQLPDGTYVKNKHNCAQKEIQLNAYDPDEEDFLTFSLTPENPQDKLPLIFTENQYNNLAKYSFTIKVDDGLLKDYQEIKLCFRGGNAC